MSNPPYYSNPSYYSGLESNHKRTTKLKEYEIIVRAISSNKKLFLKALGTSTICNTIKGQNIDLAVEQTKFIKGLQLADTGQHKVKLIFSLVAIVTLKSLQER